MPELLGNQLLTKKGILSHLASIYDPLGMISPATVKGKQIYRHACDKTKGWNGDVSDRLKREWIKRSSRLKTVGGPRSVTKEVGWIQAVHLHVFADPSNHYMLRSNHSRNQGHDRSGQRSANVKIENIKT